VDERNNIWTWCKECMDRQVFKHVEGTMYVCEHGHIHEFKEKNEN